MTQRRAFARHVNYAIPLPRKGSQTRRTCSAALTLALTVKVLRSGEAVRPMQNLGGAERSEASAQEPKHGRRRVAR
jgi:hypothetical protein